jgi:hypothetical protein
VSDIDDAGNREAGDMQDEIIGYRVLPPPIRAELEQLTRDRQAGQPATLVHIAHLVNALGKVTQFEDAELTRTVLWLLEPLNDLFRGGTNLSTTEANLRADALKAIALAPDKKRAMREVHVLLRRRLPHVTFSMVQSWHRDRQRSRGRARTDPAVQTRLDLGLPPEAGDTDEARYRWLIARLRQATES